MTLPSRLVTHMSRALKAAKEGHRTKLDVEYEGIQVRVIIQPKPDFSSMLRERQSAEAH